MQVTNLNELFTETLRDIYYAEKKLVKALPKMAKNAADGELARGFLDHCDETEGQVTRLERIFEIMQQPAKTKKCDAIEGIVAEAEQVIEEGKRGPVLDAGLIAAGQAAEHYEIARYGTLIAWAQELGQDEIVDLLQETLDQEKKADETLTEASTKINPKANSMQLRAAE